MISQTLFWILYAFIGAVIGGAFCWWINKPNCPSRADAIFIPLAGAAFWVPFICGFIFFGSLGWAIDNVFPKITKWLARPVCSSKS